MKAYEVSAIGSGVVSVGGGVVSAGGGVVSVGGGVGSSDGLGSGFGIVVGAGVMVSTGFAEGVVVVVGAGAMVVVILSVLFSLGFSCSAGMVVLAPSISHPPKRSAKHSSTVAKMICFFMVFPPINYS